MLIAIEGIDASGKATQARLLAERLCFSNAPTANTGVNASAWQAGAFGVGISWPTVNAGIPVSVLDFPHYETATGRLIRGILTDKLAVVAPVSDLNASASVKRALGAAGVEMVPASAAQAIVLQSLMVANRYEQWVRLYAASSSTDCHLILDRYWASGYAYGVADGLDRKWLLAVHEALPEPQVWVLLDIPPEESVRRRPERRDAYEADADRLTRAREAYLELFGLCNGSLEHWHIVDGTQAPEKVHEQIVEIATVHAPRMLERQAHQAEASARDAVADLLQRSR